MYGTFSIICDFFQIASPFFKKFRREPKGDIFLVFPRRIWYSGHGNSVGWRDLPGIISPGFAMLIHREGGIAVDREEELRLLCRVLDSTAAQMRTSMGNIHAALRQLETEQPRDEAGERAAAILTQSYYRLLRLVDNMSDAPLLADGKVICGVDEDVVSWLKELIDQAAPLARRQGLELTFRSTQPYHRISMHKGLMERLVWNLLSNAMKFTPAGGHIEVSLDFRGGQMLLSVADDGCGIAPELMETVFDRYLHPERLDPQPHGLGLGLPLCRRIAEGHGGRFLLTSREGEGTVATVALPDQEQGNAAEEPFALPDGGFPRALVGLSDALSYRAFLHGDGNA